ncbi:hypothetical protein J6590_100701, partial [Homalodisca vitripennis]
YSGAPNKHPRHRDPPHPGHNSRTVRVSACVRSSRESAVIYRSRSGWVSLTSSP